MDIGHVLAEAGFDVPDLFPSAVWLKNYDARAKGVSGFLFPPLSAGLRETTDRKGVRSQRFFEFVSALTSIHVGDRTAYDREGISKPCVVMDPDGEWQMVINLLHDLRSKGAFSSDVEEIVGYVDGRNLSTEDMIVGGVKKLQQGFEKSLGKRLHSVVAAYPDDYHFKSFRKDIVRSDFGVVVFGSATMHNAEYIAAGEAFSKTMGEMGVRLISGAGKESLMGAFDRGFKAGKDIFNANHPNALEKPVHIGISTNPVLRLEGPPEHLDQLIVLDDRYERLRAFFDGRGDEDKNKRASRAAKVACVFPGGIGSLEEFTTMLQLKVHGGMMEGIDIKLCNLNGYYDELIKVCEKLGVRDLFEVYPDEKSMAESVKKKHQEYVANKPLYAESLKGKRGRALQETMPAWQL